MEFREITKNAFDNYAINHPLGSFQQTSFWGRFMEGDKFHAYYVGAFIKEEIVAASLLLSYESKNVKGRLFYAPRGFLIDYKNETLLKKFTDCVKEFIKVKRGIYLKIDPYILLRDRDKDGNIIEGGVYNDFVEINLRNASFTKVDDDIQPKWLSRINLKNTSLTDISSNFSNKARQIIRRNERLGFKIRKVEFSEIEKLLEIINKEKTKYKTIMPTRTFFEDLHSCFTDKYLQLIEVYFNKNEVISNINRMIQELLIKKEERINNYHHSLMKEESFIEKEFAMQEEIKRLEQEKDYFASCREENSMGIYLFITLGNEVLALYGGIFDQYAKLDASYTMHYEMIKYALLNKYKYYNLYEIGDITDTNNKLENSFNYKKNFGGEVVELVGEYDLAVDDDKASMTIGRKHFPEYLGVKTIFK